MMSYLESVTKIYPRTDLISQAPNSMIHMVIDGWMWGVDALSTNEI